MTTRSKSDLRCVACGVDGHRSNKCPTGVVLRKYPAPAPAPVKPLCRFCGRVLMQVGGWTMCPDLNCPG